MASQVQISGGAFQDVAGNALANGYLLLELSQDAQANTDEIVSGTTIKVPLDSGGNVVTSPAVMVWPNDVLSPANTFYTVSAYSAEGQLVWGPNSQSILSTPSPYDIGAWVPGAVNVLNPGGNITGLIEAGANVTITGSGTSTSPYSIASTGGGGGGGVTSFNTRTGAVTLASGDVTTALAYTPVNKAGDTMTGALTLSANPTTNLQAATKQYVDSSSGTAITSLTGDVTATGPGAAAASVVKVNGGTLPVSSAYVGTNSSHQVVAATTPLLPANNLSDVPTASTARTNLGLGTMAIQNASAVAVTGGTVDGIDIGIHNICPLVISQAVDVLTSNSPANGDGYSLITPGAVAGGVYASGAQSQKWNVANTTGAATVASVSLGGSQALTGVQGSSGTKVAAATGSFTSGHLTSTDASGNLVDSGVAATSAATPSFASIASATNSNALVVGSSGTLNWTGSIANVFGPTITNTDSGQFSGANINLTNSVHTAQFFKASTGYIGFHNIQADDFAVINSGAGNISFQNNVSGGKVSFAANAATTPQLTVISTGILVSELGTTQTATASTTASDHSIPIVVNGTTMYMRLSSTP